MLKMNLGRNVKATVTYAIANLLTKGLAIVTVPIFTRIMTTSEIGTVTVFNSWYSMISVVASLALTSGGFQLAMKQYNNKRDEYISSILSLTSLMAIIIGCVYAIWPEVLKNVTGLSNELALLMLLLILFMPAQDFWLLRQRYEYKYKLATIITFGTAIIASFFSIIAVLYFKERDNVDLAIVRLFTNYSVIIIISIFLWIYIFLKGKTLFNVDYWKFSLSLSLPLIGNSVAVQILNVSDRTMISKILGNSEAGIYGTISTVSSMSLIVWQAINASFIPYLYDNIDNKDKRENIQSLSFILLFAFSIIAFILTIFAPEIVCILATEEYFQAIYIIPPIAAGVYLTAVSNMYSNILVYYRKTKYIMISSVLAAIINVALNTVCIRKWGYVAAAYTTLIAYIVLAVTRGIIADKVHCEVMNNKNDKVYNTNKIIALTIITVIICLLCIILYRYKIIRICSIASLIIIIIFKKDSLLKYESSLLRVLNKKK